MCARREGWQDGLVAAQAIVHGEDVVVNIVGRQETCWVGLAVGNSQVFDHGRAGALGSGIVGVRHRGKELLELLEGGGFFGRVVAVYGERRGLGIALGLQGNVYALVERDLF